MPYISIHGLKDDGITLMTGKETDEAALAGAEKGIFRQCSIGWHDECSDPHGDECNCDCHGHELLGPPIKIGE